MTKPSSRFSTTWMSLLGSLLALLAGCDSKSPYQRKQGAWYFEDVRLQDAAQPFTPLNASFAKGAHGAWYRSQAIEGAQAGSFEALDKHQAKDATQVWHGDTYRRGQDYFMIKHLRVSPIAGADAPSFRLLTAQPGYARDRSRVYFDGEPFKVADVESFEPLDYAFGRDKVQGYHQRLPVPGSEGAGFSALDTHHAKDGRHVFHVVLEPRSGNEAGQRLHSLRLPGAEPASFKVLESGYALDARQVFHRGVAIAGADAATFEIISPSTETADARDAKRRYLQGRVAPP